VADFSVFVGIAFNLVPYIRRVVFASLHGRCDPHQEGILDFCAVCSANDIIIRAKAPTFVVNAFL